MLFLIGLALGWSWGFGDGHRQGVVIGRAQMLAKIMDEYHAAGLTK